MSLKTCPYAHPGADPVAIPKERMTVLGGCNKTFCRCNVSQRVGSSVILDASTTIVPFKGANLLVAEKPINLNGVFDRLVQAIEEKKSSDPPCIDAQEYLGAKIPTQCVVRFTC